MAPDKKERKSKIFLFCSPLARKTSSWSTQSSLRADLGLSLRSRATTYLASAAGSASQLRGWVVLIIAHRSHYNNFSPRRTHGEEKATGSHLGYKQKLTYLIVNYINARRAVKRRFPMFESLRRRRLTAVPAL